MKQIADNYSDFDTLLKAKELALQNFTKKEIKEFAARFQEQQSELLKNAGGTSEDLMKALIDAKGAEIEEKTNKLIEEDRRMKNVRFQEVFTLIDTTKELLDEHITQQFEALKALMRAYVNKEVAERTQGDSSVLGQINKRLDGIDDMFNGKLKQEIENVQDQLKTQEQDLKNEKKVNEEFRESIKDQQEKAKEQ